MRIYSAFDEETQRIRRCLKEWAAVGLLSETQRLQMERDADCPLRRTNGFLRMVLFLFTMGSLSAAVALIFQLMFSSQNTEGMGILLIIFAVISYILAEFAVAAWKLYRHGIEEGLAAMAVLFLCWGLEITFFRTYSVPRDPVKSLIPAVGAAASIFLNRRFGYSYAALAAVIFAAFIPHYWVSSSELQRLFLTGLYVVSLLVVWVIRGQTHEDYLDHEYGTMESLLWFGIYLTLNLQLSSLSMLARWAPGMISTPDVAKTFYWATYALIWILPAAMLQRALTLKDRALLGLGVVTALLTLISNKPYLGWPRHEWDPMFLGILLVGIAIVVRRWLSKGPGGVRAGFTAQRLSGSDKNFMNTLAGVSGVIHQPAGLGSAKPSDGFGGGRSGGGGASSKF